MSRDVKIIKNYCLKDIMMCLFMIFIMAVFCFVEKILLSNQNEAIDLDRFALGTLLMIYYISSAGVNSQDRHMTLTGNRKLFIKYRIVTGFMQGLCIMAILILAQLLTQYYPNIYISKSIFAKYPWYTASGIVLGLNLLLSAVVTLDLCLPVSYMSYCFTHKANDENRKKRTIIGFVSYFAMCMVYSLFANIVIQSSARTVVILLVGIAIAVIILYRVAYLKLLKKEFQ